MKVSGSGKGGETGYRRLPGKAMEEGHKTIESRTSQLAARMCIYLVLIFQ